MSKKLILGVTIGGSSRLLDGQPGYFRKLGYEVFLISQNHYKEKIFCEKEGIVHLPVNIDNSINPIKDIIAFIQIITHIRRVRPDIVNLGTPKMGFLGIIAAWMCGVKIRIYTCRGLVFENKKGVVYSFLKIVEIITVKFASKVIYVSHSLLLTSQKHKVFNGNKSVVLGDGTSNGVNLSYFNLTNINRQERKRLIEKYSLEGKLVIGFVGRISREKGVYELVEAFEDVNKLFNDTRLIMMGHIKCKKSFINRLKLNSNIFYIPFQENVPLYMSLFDLLVLPSWREGFPNVPIQAAAMNMPVIVSNATGCLDSVNPGVNGIIFEKGNTEKLKQAILFYLENPDIRQKHGQSGIEWAKKFKNESVWERLNEFYNQQS